MIDSAGERTRFIDHVGGAVRHAGGKVPSRSAEHNDNSAGHVFAAVVSRPLDDSNRPGISDRKAIACLTSGNKFPAGGSIQDGVAHDDVLVRRVGVPGAAVWPDDDFGST